MLPFIAIYLIVGLLLLVAARQTRRLWLRRVGANLLITYVVVALLALSGEAYFRFVFAESDGLPTLASRNWLARYWHTNSLGYRDRDWTAADWQGKHTILVVGDSFTAGWGIDDPADRFPDVLASRLDDGHVVINLGKQGASTVDELTNLKTYPLQAPDWVILQYTLNDIETAALSIGLNPGLNPLNNVPSWVNESHLANFLFWRFVGAFQPEMRGMGSYIDWLHAMYDHSVVWDIHRRQIEAFIDHVERLDAQLGVVIFPDMHNPFASIPYVDRVAQVFEARGYGSQVIKLFDAAEAMPFAERVVSPRDLHASVKFHHLVGEMMAGQWFAAGQ